jgi:beta-glucanase (GH16 family)
MKYTTIPAGAKSVRNVAAILSTSALAAMLLISTGTVSHAQAPGGMHQVWSDEFTGASTSATPYSGTWSYDTGAGGWGNNEWETYVNSWANCHVIWDGTGTDSQALQIEAQTDSSGRWYSARINTNGKHNFGPYGYYEARCKFPNSGQGYWPAFWMLGTNIGSVGWPACGEIDIAEEINGQWENHQSLHMPGWDPTLVTSPYQSTTTYHNYGANWQPGYITFYVDGNATGTFSRGGGGTWVFDNQTTFILLNLAIGGNWPGNPTGAANGNFDIDYVRQYEW